MRSLYIFLLFCFAGSQISGQTENTINLKIVGNDSTESTLINKIGYNSNLKNKSYIIAELEELKNNLTNSGYLDTTYDFIRKNDSLYTAIFDTQKQYATLSLEAQKNEHLEKYIRQTGRPLIDDTIILETAFAKAYLKQLSSIASNNGNPFAKFQITDITKRNKHTLHGNLTYTAEKTRTVDHIQIKGYTDIPQSFLKYSIGLKEGAIFNRKKINQQSASISSLPFITQVKPPEVLFTIDSTTVYLYVEKRNANKFDGFLGFANEEDNSLRLDGYLDLLLVNNFNFGETFILNYKADGGDQSQLSISTQLPYLFKTPIGIEASLKLFRRDSTFSTTNQSIGLLYQRNQKNSFTIGFESEQSENLTENNNSLQNNLKDYNSKRITTSFRHQQVSSDLFFPIKRQFYFQAGFGDRTIQNDIEKQISLTAVLENDFTLNNRQSIFLKNTTKYLISNNFLTNELFRFGGILSMRGFEENSLLANFYNTLNTEYRYKLNNTIYINSIIDLGYLENKNEDTKAKLYSFGLGTGIQTRAGLLKLNISNGLFDNQPLRFIDTKLHIILEVRF